jgi:maleylpyruvate isomerase
LLADLRTSAAALTAEAASLADADWEAEVRGLRGAPHPAWYTMWRRLSEVEIHHVDLDAGYGPPDWPAEFAAGCLAQVAADFSRPDCPAAVLQASDSDLQYRIGPAGAVQAVEVSGPARQLLAWLIGRSAGLGLTAYPAGQLPSPPAW